MTLSELELTILDASFDQTPRPTRVYVSPVVAAKIQSGYPVGVIMPTDWIMRGIFGNAFGLDWYHDPNLRGDEFRFETSAETGSPTP